MSMLTIAVMLASLNSPATAQSPYDIPAKDMQRECFEVVHPEATPQSSERVDTRADDCVNAVADYLIDNRIMFPAPRPAGYAVAPPDRPFISAVTCGAQLILNHSADSRTISEILAAEFSKACEPATM